MESAVALFADQVVALSRKVEAMNAALSRLERRVESLAAVAPSAAAVSPALQALVREAVEKASRDRGATVQANCLRMMHNAGGSGREPLRWLANDVGQLPPSPPATAEAVLRAPERDIDRLLEFYGLEWRGRLAEKRERLLGFIGVGAPNASPAGTVPPVGVDDGW